MLTSIGWMNRCSIIKQSYADIDLISDRLLTKEATGDYDIMGTQKEKKKGLVQRGLE